MKKILALLLTVVLVATMGVTVFATPSSEAQGIISGITVIGGDDAEVGFVINKIDGKVDKDFTKTYEDLKDEKDDKSLKVVGQFELEVDEDAEYPLSISLKVLGISNTSNVYILAKTKDGEVIVITPEVKNGKLVFDVEEEIEKFAVATDSKTATKVEKENDVKSPQTADMSVFVVITAFVSLVAIAVLPKKIKN